VNRERDHGPGTIARGNLMGSRSWRAVVGQSIVFFVLGGVVLGFAARLSSAQTQTSTPIQVETREVVLPVLVFQEKKDPKAALIGPNGTWYPTWRVYVERVNNLTKKSVHIFEDGTPQQIESFAPGDSTSAWVIDNAGVHLEHSLTPKGIWYGPDQDKIRTVPSEPFQWYLLTYIPPSSPVGSCHRITVKVDHKHATVLAPDRYCNTKDPLSDPLNGTELGKKLLEQAASEKDGALPVTVQVSSFRASSGEYRVNVSAGFPPDLLGRRWEANRLVTSIAILGLIYNTDGDLVARFSDDFCELPACQFFYEGGLQPKNAQLPPILEAEKYFADMTIPTAYHTQTDLGPGSYRLKLLITDGEKFGRVATSFVLDPLAQDGLAISDVAVCDRYHPETTKPRVLTRAPQYAPFLAKGMEFTPAGDLQFKKAQQLVTYLEIYDQQPETADPPKLYLEMKVTDIRTGELEVSSGLRPVEPSSQASKPAIPAVWDMAIDKLPPGSYRIEVQASDSRGKKSDGRMASFVLSGSSALPQSANLIGSSGVTNLQGASPTAVLPQGAHAQDLAASDVLKKIAETYRRLSSFSAVAERKVDLDTDTSGKRQIYSEPEIYPGSHDSEEIEITMMASNSSKTKLLLKDGKKEVVVVSDGKVVWTLLPAQDAYTQVAANSANIQTPVNLLQIGSNDISGVDLLGEYETLFAARFPSISSYDRWAKLEHSEALNVGKDKKECYVVTIQMPGGVQKQKLWVDKTEFTIWKSVDTRTSVNTSLSGTFDPGVSLQTTVTVTMKQMALNPSLDDSNFLFTPPDKAKKVDSLKLSGKNPF
jgi:outer membrane lipoprotein-sorting protein